MSAEARDAGRAPAIEVCNLSKSYSRNLRQAQRNGVAAILSEIRRPGREADDLRAGEFWAVRDVSFEVDKGGALGLLGRNGAGKSTLLRLVAGITRPTSGEVVRRGTVGSLLDPNAGFNTVLTGRENVEAAFTLLSGRRPSPAIVRDIISYAGIRAAIDHPVRTYSQGMRMRLGFSVMVHVDPDILVIDEAVAVGDTAFQLQCIDYLHSYCRSGGVLIFASHSLWLFQNLATSGLHLEGGSVVHEGLPDEVADHYIADLQGGSWVDMGEGPDVLERERVLGRSEADGSVGRSGVANDESDATELPTSGQRPVRFVQVDVHGREGSPPRSGEPLTLRFSVTSAEPIESAEFGFMIWTADLSICVVADLSHTIAEGHDVGTFSIGGGVALITCRIERLPLTPGHYAVRAAVYDAPTSDIMGLFGIEDTPRWFEVVGPELGPSGAAGDPSAVPGRLRPLRVIEIEAGESPPS